jgi:serine/threonine protein kinase
VSSVPVKIDPGCAVGPYVVERRLAQGGMSVLFLAHDEQLARQVVLKVVPDDLSTSSSRARLMREARALASVDHPGVVRVYGTGDHLGTPWIAMEYVRGTDLKRVLAERGPVAPDRALRWIVLACEALAAAHDAGVIHRDLKPSNILLTEGDQITIVDFGIAKRRDQAQSGDVLTSQRELLGTPAYLSPEQLEHGIADERSDVWALGCVLYELVVGNPPFGKGGSATTMAAILRDEPIYPSHLPSPVVQLIGGCLRKSSFARIGSARELASLAKDVSSAPLDVVPELTRASARATPSAMPVRTSEPPARHSSRVPVRGSTPPPGMRSSARVRASQPVGSMRAALSGRIKGTAIRAGLQWYAHTYGDRAMTGIFDRATPDLRAMLRPTDAAFGIIASGWYDVQLVGELLELMEQTAADDDLEAYTNALTQAIAKDNVGGIYRSLFKLVSTPSMLEANVQRVWRTYCDEGTFVARVPTTGQMSAEIRGWVHHHPTVCRVVGSMMQNVLRAVGYQALIIERTQCVSSGDAYCAFEGLYLV